MSQVAMPLDELRDVVGEVDTLAALAPEPYDHEDRKGADRLIVERTACLLGTIARSAATAGSKSDDLVQLALR
jgi:hypothetical protein